MPASGSPEHWMLRAVKLSRKGFPAPNPHVGCVIVKFGTAVGEGWHHQAGGQHAEIMALEAAGGKARGADVYVTLEPCNHTGRTGPCSQALSQAGVARVFVACKDPNPAAQGGLAHLKEAGVMTHLGLCREEAASANRVWMTAMENRRPFVTAKAASSLDGRIALPSGESQWITGEKSRRQARRLRAEMGTVLVGRSTAEKDDPKLTVRIPGIKNQPLRIVLDPDRRLSNSLALFSGTGRVWRVVKPGLAQGVEDVEIACEGGRFDLHALVAKIWKEGETGLVAEGGGITLGRFFEAGLVDRVDLFLSPKILGSGKPWVEGLAIERLSEAILSKELSVRRIEEDVWLQAWLREAPKPLGP